MQGLHLTADLYGCRCDARLLTDADALSALCRRAVAGTGLTAVADRFFAFPEWQGQPGGVTGAVLLAESHLAVHTWPERAGVTLDVYVCNFTTDNSDRAERLLEEMAAAFEPADRQANRLLRGTPGEAGTEHALLLEWLNEDSAYGFRATRKLETVRSPHQVVEVFDTRQFGRLFRLDGAFMTSERDEFIYHENMVHAAAVPHPAPRRALVLGGGDGGSSEELLKHPGMERVVMAELDAAVIDVAKRHLRAVHRGVFDDPRLEVRVGDGFAFVHDLAARLRAGDASTGRFDLVVLDLTDPDTPARQLYTRGFFEAVRRVLTPGGAMTLHLGSPVFQPERVRRLVQDLRATFRVVRPFTVHVPLYGSQWGMAVASDSLDPLDLSADEVDRRIAARGLPDLRYYNGDVHRALFALPNHLRELLG